MQRCADQVKLRMVLDGDDTPYLVRYLALNWVAIVINLDIRLATRTQERA